MQKTNIINVMVSALNPKKFPVMLKKILKRIMNKKGTLSKNENLEWISAHNYKIEEFANALDPELWEQAKLYEKKLQINAELILGKIKHNLGGGGACQFLHFLTRYFKPDIIVETGVAAGYSTHAFLTGMASK